MKAIFTTIYDKNIWGGSGSGSNMSNRNKYYMSVLSKIIDDHNIKTICDVGCGDWEFSKHFGYDKRDITYLGVDCVESVVDTLKQNYQGENVSFDCKTIGDSYIPEGYDLVILKDVIQHWEDKDILTILPLLLEKNKYVFITNGYKFQRLPEKNDWKQRVLDKRYYYHPVDIYKYPLNQFNQDLILTDTYYTKQMNLYTRQ